MGHKHRPDIVFLLAVGAHLVNWNDVIMFAGTLADEMLFEANGADFEQLGQEPTDLDESPLPYLDEMEAAGDQHEGDLP